MLDNKFISMVILPSVGTVCVSVGFDMYALWTEGFGMGYKG